MVWVKLKSNANDASKNAKPSSKGQAILVTAYIVAPQTIDNKVQVTGSIMANEEVELKTETAGKITGLYIKEGSRVKKGELLVKINDADLQGQLKKIQNMIKLDSENEFREKKLLDAKGISQEEYDVALNKLNADKADEDIIKAQIAKTEIKAPFDGVVGLRNVSEGSYISNATTVAFVVELDPVKIDFSIPEKYMNEVKTRDEVIFSVAGIKKDFIGIIYAIEPRIDMTSRTIEIRAHASNKDQKLLSGAFASIELVLKKKENIIMVPTQSIIPALKAQKVFLAKNGKAVPAMVETGMRTDASIEITNGLQVGDTVITTGIMQLRPNVPVKVIDVK